MSPPQGTGLSAAGLAVRIASAVVGQRAVGLAERRVNRVHRRPPYAASERARTLHRTLDVADLHADSLLWGRDLLHRANRGHVDVPRLIEGGVALQVLAMCVTVPRTINLERTTDGADLVTLVGLAQGWPPPTWRSLVARTLYLADRAQEMADRSAGRLTLIRTRGDLTSYLQRRRENPRITAALLAVEGARALEDDLANVDRLAAAGVRMLSPTHFADTSYAGSAHGVGKGGLTGAGRDLVERMESLSMTVDLSHGSAATIDDVLTMARRPVIVSHTGVQGTSPGIRNLSDGHLRRVAETGGLVGIGFWPMACGGEDAAAIARAIRHAVSVAGVEHVSLGSDWDGAVSSPFDATGIVQVTDALLDAGFPDGDVARIMGGNVFRLLAETLPDR